MIAIRRMGVVVVVAVIAAGCATIDRVNTSSTGSQANADAGTSSFGVHVAVSGSGRFVAFNSLATNLVSGVTDGRSHVYRKDRLTGVTVSIDRSATGQVNPSEGSLAAISDDGRKVAFITDAALSANDLNTKNDLFVRDVDAATTELASLMPDGSQIPGGTGEGVFRAAFDRSGRVLFEVGAGTVPPRNRLELRDLTAKTTTEVLGNSQATTFSFSRNGEHVVFNNGCFQIGGCFPVPGAVDLANAYPFTASVCANSGVSGISDDGRYVFYQRSGFGPGCVGGPARFDRQTGTWLDLSLASSAANQFAAGLSGDGRFALIGGDDTTLPGGTVGFRGAFVRDAVTGWVGRVSADALDHAANATETFSDVWAISGDGRTAVLTSDATNLVGGDTNSVNDVFARALPRAAATSAAPSSLSRGANHKAVVISGEEFVAGVIASFSGTGVTVHSAIPSADGHTLTLDVSVASGATVGVRALTVFNVGGFGGVQSVCPGCLTIT